MILQLVNDISDDEVFLLHLPAGAPLTAIDHKLHRWAV